MKFINQVVLSIPQKSQKGGYDLVEWGIIKLRKEILGDNLVNYYIITNQ